jgi:hypothetical protein
MINIAFQYVNIWSSRFALFKSTYIIGLDGSRKNITKIYNDNDNDEEKIISIFLQFKLTEYSVNLNCQNNDNRGVQ